MSQLWISIKNFLAGGAKIKEYEREIFEFKSKSPKNYISGLFELLKHGKNNEKIFCCLLLRQSLSIENTNNNIWEHLNDAEKNYVKSELLYNILIQREMEVIKHVCICVSELEIFLLTNGSMWEELIMFLFENLRGDDNAKCAVLNILAEICTFIHFEIFDRKIEIIEVCKIIIRSGNAHLYFSIFGFVCKYLAVLREDEIQEFSELLEMCLDTLGKVRDGKEAENLAKLLRDLAESNPDAFKGRMVSLGLMIKSSGNWGNLDFLNVCFDIFTCLCPALYQEIQDNQRLVQVIFEEIYKFMLKTSEYIEKDWLYPEVENFCSGFDSVEIDYSKLGANHISSIIQALGEDQTVPHILVLISSELKLNSPDWRNNYSCILILSELGQFVDSQVSLSELINLLPILFDTMNPKQKCALFDCISRFSNDFGQEFTEKYFSSLFPLLFNSLVDQTPKIVSESLKSLKFFCSNSSQALISYITPILFPVIPSLLSHKNYTVISSALSLLSCLSVDQTINSNFSFKEILLKLNEIIASPQSTSSIIRGKALETAAIICSQQVNDDTKLYCLNLMQTMKNFKDSEIEKNDPLIAFILSAWHKLAPIFPQEFTEYITDILPGIFTVLHNKEKFTNSEEGQVQVLALETLLIISQNLKQYFAPFMSKTIETVLPFLKNTQNSCIREKTAEILPILLQTGRYAQMELIEIGKKLLFELWDSLLTEFDNKVKAKQILAIQLIIEIVGENFMSSEEVQTSWDNLLGIIEFLYKDIKSVSSQVITEEYEDVYTAVSGLVGIIFKTHRNLCSVVVCEVFSKILPVFLNTDEPVIHKKLAVFIIDDMIEYLGQDRVFDKWSLCAETIFIYSVHYDHCLRQAALYGLGLLAQFTSNNTFLQWKNIVLDIFNKSIHCIPLKHTKEFIHARENAISALGKVIQYQGVNFDLNNLIPEFILLLPLKNDIEEGKKMHDLFGDLCLSYPLIVFGENFKRGKLIVEIIGAVVDSQVCEQSTVKNIRRVLEYLWNEWKEGLMISINNLTSIQQIKIKNLMNQ